MNARLPRFDTRKVQHEFDRHKGDWGFSGKNYNKQNDAAFRQAITNHMADPHTQVIPGTYRGNIRVTHFYNPNKGLWSVVDQNGQFVAGWRLSPPGSST